MNYRGLIPLLAAAPPIRVPPTGGPHCQRDPLGEAVAMLAEARAASDRMTGRGPEAAAVAFAGATLDLRRRLVAEYGGAVGGRAWDEAMRRLHRPVRRHRGLHAA